MSADDERKKQERENKRTEKKDNNMKIEDPKPQVIRDQGPGSDKKGPQGKRR